MSLVDVVVMKVMAACASAQASWSRYPEAFPC